MPKVKYVGGADVRLISEQEFNAAGVSDVPEGYVARWDGMNDWTIEGQELSFLAEDQFKRIIQNDKDFQVVDDDNVEAAEAKVEEEK